MDLKQQMKAPQLTGIFRLDVSEQDLDLVEEVVRDPEC